VYLYSLLLVKGGGGKPHGANGESGISEFVHSERGFKQSGYS